MFNFRHVTLSHQFLLVSFLILLTGMLVIGLWVGRQIEVGVITRTAAVTALYVDSFVAPHLQSLGRSGQLDEAHRQELDSLLTGTPLGQRIVSFKIWAPDGRILYSTHPELIGRRFPITPGLAAAFAGEVHTHVSNLNEPENEYERRYWSGLIETYAPVRAEGKGTILAVSEFYQTTDELAQEVRAAQWRSWLVVGVATLAMYLLLAGLVGRASQTITAQQSQLQAQVDELASLLARNEQLHGRIRRAAARTTALNERFLRRISADLHDGPGQDLGLALLRMDALTEGCRKCAAATGNGRTVGDDFDTVRLALQSALSEVRAISAGLRLPELEKLAPAAVAERAARDYQRKSGRQVDLVIGELPEEAPLPVKITLYRLLQESLANSYRHAGEAGQQVEILYTAGGLDVCIRDDGRGFDPQAAPTNDRLGLTGMRERVELLGGTFTIHSAPGAGVTIEVRLPLTLAEVEDA
jgi:signal transduction histidine kinase